MKYSVEDMDKMREAIKTREIPHPNPYGAKDVTEWMQQVEIRLRTYMLNGTLPEEIEAKPVLWESGYVI